MSFLGLYDSLEVIGNGSFGVIRRVRRKSDGLLFARKELFFERMNERDRKQIVAEVNILKNLKHDHIVRYHDRYVDRDAGILYILMEYCGGGDLLTIIKQALNADCLIPEDTIWDYFMQILLALNHCHHPYGSGRTRSLDDNIKEKRSQVLHRDLKPDNVFLDEDGRIKLGDFGLAKALPQSNLAFSYVGTPYYMSPELMQEKAYDSKSDIWSLGCLIYELCALKPPFHEAETYTELSLCIRNGRIPPLPRGYSPSLWAVIKSMLNLNPAMRPSAAQLLQHERVDLAFRNFEAEKTLSAVRNREGTVGLKEQELRAWEASLLERESRTENLLSEKDSEIASLQTLVSQLQRQVRHDNEAVEQRVREELSKRQKALRAAVMKYEEEVALAMARGEQCLLNVVKAREEEIFEMWQAREEEIKNEILETVEEREVWIENQAEELRLKADTLDGIRKELEVKLKLMTESSSIRKQRKPRSSSDDVHSILPRVVSPDAEDLSTPSEQSFFSTSVDERNVSWPPHDSLPSGTDSMATKGSLSMHTVPDLVKFFAKPSEVGLDLMKILDLHVTAEDDTERPSSSSVEGPGGQSPASELLPQSSGNPYIVSSLDDAAEIAASASTSFISDNSLQSPCDSSISFPVSPNLVTNYAVSGMALKRIDKDETRMVEESSRLQRDRTLSDGMLLTVVSTEA